MLLFLLKLFPSSLLPQNHRAQAYPLPLRYLTSTPRVLSNIPLLFSPVTGTCLHFCSSSSKSCCFFKAPHARINSKLTLSRHRGPLSSSPKFQHFLPTKLLRNIPQGSDIRPAADASCTSASDTSSFPSSFFSQNPPLQLQKLFAQPPLESFLVLEHKF